MKTDEAARAAKAAAEQWKKAPLHVRTMAGAYIEPVIYALNAMAMAVQAIEAGQGVSNGAR